jgi:hypothetical protein
VDLLAVQVMLSAARQEQRPQPAQVPVLLKAAMLLVQLPLAVMMQVLLTTALQAEQLTAQGQERQHSR